VRQQVAAAYGRNVDELLDQVYDFRPRESEGRIEAGPFTVDLTRVNHPIETYGMRVEAGGRSLAYSADTGACDALVEIARGADLFLCEASYLDGDSNPPNVHLTGREAGEHAARADVGKLLLTHLVPWGDPTRTLGEAERSFDGDIEVAHALGVHEV
jgi:ribonuclease BN (tRNA processing enzyme)